MADAWLASHRQRMVRLLSRLARHEGAWPSPITGVSLLRNSTSYPPVSAFYEPSMVFVAQGLKRLHHPDAVMTYSPRHFLLVTVPVPADCEAVVTEEGPFLGMAVRIDLQTLAEVSLLTHGSPHGKQLVAERTIATPPVDREIAACSRRLLKAMFKRTDAAVLGPLLVRELHYRALNSKGSSVLRSLLAGHAGRQRIHGVLGRMHADFAAPFQVEREAREIGMSTSTFHERFREVTGSSPLSYLKQLRLHRARTLMVQTELTAAQVCEQVGYVSQSQFSREFKREFGRPPLDETRRVRSLLTGL